jgi:hypothetical protein
VGDLFDKLQKNAEKAKQENKTLEVERNQLIREKEVLEEKLKDLKTDQTEH